MKNSFHCPLYKKDISQYDCDELSECVNSGYLLNDGLPHLMPTEEIQKNSKLCIKCQSERITRKKLTGKEIFMFDGHEVGFNLLDFWSFEYSNVYDLQDEIAEFIVAKALGINLPHNKERWTLYDILYRDTRIEIKETSYYHPWNENGNISNRRTFGIGKAHSLYEFPDETDKYERQNDLYIFCVVNGENRDTSNPLMLNNWDFYIVPTSIINEKCNENKTISLSRICSLGFTATKYDELRQKIDEAIDKSLNI